MKTTLRSIRNVILVVSLFTTAASLRAQGTAFTYQGRLNTNSVPYTGSVEFQFTLWDAVSGGNAVATNNPVSVIGTVTDGLFTTPLEFGSDPFNGQPRFLQIEARTTIGPFFTLTPRQPLTATPYALRALNLTTNGLTAGIYTSAVTFNNAGNNFFGRHSGNGGNLTNVNAATLGGLGSASFWRTTGNAGANPTNGNFLGTTDNLALEIKVNGLRALRLEPNTSAAPNVIGGASVNYVSNSVVGATIAGGGATNYYGNSNTNRVTADFGTVSGGGVNTASGTYATLGGGYGNTASGNAATVGGGGYNTAGGQYATGGGGIDNTASGYIATVGGGSGNTASDDYATVGGGLNNAAGQYATVVGGRDNTASGSYSFAAGRQAQALHAGSFVWNDGNTAATASTANNSVTFRASGGYRLFSHPTATIGVSLAASGNAWAIMSDRHRKKDIQPLDERQVLQKLAAIPISTWHYDFESAEDPPHIGPMAQDFKAAFYPGRDDKTISTLEFDGVALAAIQGLNQKVEEQREENAKLKRELSEIKQLLVQLSNKKN